MMHGQYIAVIWRKITEELLYELFLQADPLERVAIPKDNEKIRFYALITYKYQASVPYALSVMTTMPALTIITTAIKIVVDKHRWNRHRYYQIHHYHINFKCNKIHLQMLHYVI